MHTTHWRRARKTQIKPAAGLTARVRLAAQGSGPRRWKKTALAGRGQPIGPYVSALRGCCSVAVGPVVCAGKQHLLARLEHETNGGASQRRRRPARVLDAAELVPLALLQVRSCACPPTAAYRQQPRLANSGLVAGDRVVTVRTDRRTSSPTVSTPTTHCHTLPHIASQLAADQSLRHAPRRGVHFTPLAASFAPRLTRVTRPALPSVPRAACGGDRRTDSRYSCPGDPGPAG